MRNIIKLGLITFLLMTNINAITIHDLFDTTTKGKSAGGLVNDNELAKDGLGIVTLQGQTGGSTTVSNELKIQSILNKVIETSNDQLLISDVKSNLLSGNLGTTAQLNEVNAITAQTSAGNGGSTQGSISIKCVGETIGSLHNEGGVDYLVVDKNTLQTMVQNYQSENLEHVCTSNVTDMSSLFSSLSIFGTSFNQDISKWDVSNVTNMSSMFGNTSVFNQDISKWDVSNVIYMQYMFQNANKFNQDIGNWDVSNVIDMYYMFGYANEFNQDIGNWDVSNVTNLGFLFTGASLFNQDISNWNVNNVTNMSYMFYDAISFNQDLTGWNVSNVSNFSNFNTNATNFTLIPNF